MRIALLTHDIPGSSMSGVGSYTLQCAAALVRSGHEPHVFTFDATEETRQLVPPGAKIHSLPDLGECVGGGVIDPRVGAIIGRGGLATQMMARGEMLCQAVRDVHKDLPFDIVETPEVCCPGLSLMLHRIPGVPVVTMLHAGTAISRHYNDLAPSEEDQLLMASEFAGIALADGLCAPTRAVVEATRQFMPFKQEVDVFPSPVPGSEWHTAQKTESPTQEYVLFAGRIERLKGCCELAAAANLFLRTCPDATLCIYGPDRPLSATLRWGEHFRDENEQRWRGGTTREWVLFHLTDEVRSRVRFMGTVPAPQMSAAYAGCRFVVMPSLFENFGTTAAEALVAGKPVVYFAGTGLDETVADAGLPARRADPMDLAAQMIRLWKDAALRKSLAARGTRRLQNELATETAIARRVAFYQQTLSKHAAEPAAGLNRLGLVPPASLHALLCHSSRLVGSLAGTGQGELRSPGTRAAHALRKLFEAGGVRRSLWIYGAGQHTRRLLVERQALESAGARLCGIIDDAAKPGDTLCHVPVINRIAAESQHQEGTLEIDAVLLSSDSIEEKLWSNTEYFRRHQIPVIRLYTQEP